MTLIRDSWTVFSRAMRLSLRQPSGSCSGCSSPSSTSRSSAPCSRESPPTTRPSAATPGGVRPWPAGAAGHVRRKLRGLRPHLRVALGRDRAHARTPAPRAALLIGRVARDVLVLLVQGSILVVAALAMGLRAPWWALGVGIGTVALLGACFSSLSAVALKLKSEDAFAPLLNGIILPVALLSGIFLPMTLAPRWLQHLSDANPLKHSSTACGPVPWGPRSSTSLWGIALTLGLWSSDCSWARGSSSASPRSGDVSGRVGSLAEPIRSRTDV